MKHFTLQLSPDMKSMNFFNNKLCIEISQKENNGLSTHNGSLRGFSGPDGPDGDPGTMNVPGNALGPYNATESTPLKIIGFNNTVSRHKRYTGSDEFVKDNDGMVMTKLEETQDHTHQLVPNGSIAAYMISYAQNGVGGGENNG